MPIAKKNPITQVKFSYTGTEEEFEAFLKTIVRDFLRADDPAAISHEEIVDKVESEVA